MHKYILRNKKPVRCRNLMTWAKWMENADRIVSKANRGEVEVSTVFLGLDHNFGSGVPLLFETMVFGGSGDGNCARCSTWDQAKKQHAAMCFEVFGMKLVGNG